MQEAKQNEELDKDACYEKSLSRLKSLHYRVLNVIKKMSYDMRYNNIYIKFSYNNLMLNIFIIDKYFKYYEFGDFLYSINVDKDLINKYNSVFNYDECECRVMFISKLTLYSGMLYESITTTK